MPYNPKIHKRHSIRLKGYDYSQDGLYFMTICINHHKCLLGNIVDEKMILNQAGHMALKWWQELSPKFQHINLYNFVVMPNHIHGVIQIDGGFPRDFKAKPSLPNHLGGYTNPPLPTIMQCFKIMTTTEYIRNVKTQNWPRFEKRLWQRNYYDHIIRTEKSYSQIADYIEGTPSKWQKDKYFSKNI